MRRESTPARGSPSLPPPPPTKLQPPPQTLHHRGKSPCKETPIGASNEETEGGNKFVSSRALTWYIGSSDSSPTTSVDRQQ
ncbi:hypothetical protein L484_006603 [Morus notabilis]|uniref:Uncharacterized protein n=1 Tax=Morus notabilis TaxID=981085 RepID=W9RVE4_9ROSA|nr:hypothetical protein L484_006603 [Morus notabilis]